MGRLGASVLVIALVAVGWIAGVLSARHRIPPQPAFIAFYASALEGFGRIGRMIGVADPPWWVTAARRDAPADHADPARMAPGLTLLAGAAGPDRMRVWVADADGAVVQEWPVDWFAHWPDDSHLPEAARPVERPGTVVHGVSLQPDGDIVFNYELLGLIRVNACGEVVWRLPRRTHHSVHRDPSTGSLWVGVADVVRGWRKDRPGHWPWWWEQAALEVSPEGEPLREIAILDVLRAAGLTGLMHMSTIDNWSTRVRGDTMHGNDVEPFPAGMASTVFRPGDLMLSLRNINAVIVFDPETLAIRYKSVGRVLRQHDPDFLPGDVISVFDNNNLAPQERGGSSRIVELDATDPSGLAARTVFEGSADAPFYTDIMGVHQRLPNGNILIAEARAGRVFEVTADGEEVWSLANAVGDGLRGVVSAAERLPPELDAAHFAAARAACGG